MNSLELLCCMRQIAARSNIKTFNVLAANELQIFNVREKNPKFCGFVDTDESWKTGRKRKPTLGRFILE